MSNLPISSRYRSTPNVPVSDAERDELTTRLNDAYTDGQLSQDEWRVRLDQLYAAQTLGELVPVADGLPARATYATPSIVAQGTGRPGELTPSKPASRFAWYAGATVVGLLIVLAVLLGLGLMS